MAGQGPPPKDPSVRRNKTAPKRGEWVDLQPLEKPILAPLPEDEDWPALTRAAWEAWRSDPVTSQWSEADVAYARDTIRMHARMQEKPAAAPEVRLRMDSLGLTPKGKRDLRWRIVDEAEDAPAKPTRKRGEHDGRRARLSVVKG